MQLKFFCKPFNVFLRERRRGELVLWDPKVRYNSGALENSKVDLG